MSKLTAEERFAEKWIKDANGCHVWTVSKTHDGYGNFKMNGGTRQAHRVAWEWTHGPIPEAKQIDHLCRNRACTNVEHLELVTSKENTLRGTSFSAVNARKTHCIRGHALVGDNLRIDSNNHRVCIICKRAKDRVAKARYRAKLRSQNKSELK